MEGAAVGPPFVRPSREERVASMVPAVLVTVVPVAPGIEIEGMGDC